MTTYTEAPPDYDDEPKPAWSPLDPTDAAADAEIAVAGAAISRVDCAEAAGAVLMADGSQFGNLRAGAAFAAALRLVGAGAQSLGPAAVLQQMHRDGTANLIRGDIGRLFDLTQRSAIGVGNTLLNAEIVSSDAIRRHMVRACFGGGRRASDPAFDPAVDVDAIISDIQAVALGRAEARDLYARDHMAKLVERLRNPDQSPIVPWPWEDMDTVVKLRGGRFVLI
jgi:hypothetical protein